MRCLLIMAVMSWGMAGIVCARAPATVPVQGKILVLPFAPLGEAAKPEWLGTAVQQNLVAELSRGGAFQVTAGKAKEPVSDAEAALRLSQEAGTAYVVFGTYQFVEKDLRFTGQVLDVSKSVVVGGLKATGVMRDLFLLEDSLASQLKVALGKPLVEKRDVVPPEPAKELVRALQPPERPWDEEDVVPAPRRIWGDYDDGYDRYRYGYPYYPIVVIPAGPSNFRFHGPQRRSTGGLVGSDGRWLRNAGGSVRGRHTFPWVP